jgi:hypothetical protein
MSAMMAVAAALETAASAVASAVWAAIMSPFRTAFRATLWPAFTDAFRATLAGAHGAAVWTAGDGTAIASVSTVTPVSTVATSIGTSSASPVAIPPAALRPLETRTRIAADARGIAAHKFFARSVGIAGGTGFTGKQDSFFFQGGTGGSAFRGNGLIAGRFRMVDGRFGMFGARSFDQFGLAIDVVMFVVVFAVVTFVVGVFFMGFVFMIFFRMAGFETPDGMLFFGMFGIALSCVRLFFVMNFAGGFVFFLFIVFFFEDAAPGKVIGFGSSLSLFMLGFDEASGQGVQLFIA